MQKYLAIMESLAALIRLLSVVQLGKNIAQGTVWVEENVLTTNVSVTKDMLELIVL